MAVQWHYKAFSGSGTKVLVVQETFAVQDSSIIECISFVTIWAETSSASSSPHCSLSCAPLTCSKKSLHSLKQILRVCGGAERKVKSCCASGSSFYLCMNSAGYNTLSSGQNFTACTFLIVYMPYKSPFFFLKQLGNVWEQIILKGGKL